VKKHNSQKRNPHRKRAEDLTAACSLKEAGEEDEKAAISTDTQGI